MRSINLLPPESRVRAAARRRQALWVLLGIGYLAVLAALYFWWQGGVGEAEDDLEAQRQVVAQVEAEIADLRDLEELRTGFESRVAVIDGILERDVAWGRLLNDLARLIPPRVWLGSFTGNVDTTGTGPAIGQISISGTAFDYPDVASWLRALDSTNFPGVADTWVSSVSSSAIGAADVVDFSSQTFLTDGALSTRVEERVPALP